MTAASNPYNKLSARPIRMPPGVQRNPGKVEDHIDVVYISQVGKIGRKATQSKYMIPAKILKDAETTLTLNLFIFSSIYDMVRFRKTSVALLAFWENRISSHFVTGKTT